MLMKKNLLKNFVKDADSCKLCFLLGTIFGIFIGMLLKPFSKGIAIGSYNGCNNHGNGCDNNASAKSTKGLPINNGKKELKK